ncbi:hypothetical protein EG329_012185 [Mollisiaceae sp. DMI_Dod_QoI]|nr:hypothetical protein EG329_012185 [Helotiales sp. DMI_Dod_QoI]
MATTRRGTSDGTTQGQLPEKERTAEQLAAIHAAMMEELGIGRKDELPLEDRGFDGFVPDPTRIKKPVVKGGVGAAWHDIQFDDVNPADEELDSIADGQLYRLRRGSSQNGHQQSFRGRGGSSRRGGHASAGRGGAHNTRDMGRHPLPPPLHTATQNFFNDARRGVNNHSRIDEFINTLREERNSTNGPRRKKKPQQAPPSNHQIPLGPSAAPMQSSNAPSPRRFRQPAASVWTLASTKDFLVHAGIDTKIGRPNGLAAQPVTAVNSTPSTRRQAAMAPSTTTKEPSSNGPSPAKARLPQEHMSAHQTQAPPKVPILPLGSSEKKVYGLPGNPVQANQPKQGVGLAASKYAEEVIESDLAISIPQTVSHSNKENENPFAGKQSAGLSVSRWASDQLNSSRAIKREHGVSIKMGDNRTIMPGQARLLKSAPEDKFFTLELEVGGNIVASETVDDDVFFSHVVSTVTFQAADRGQSPPVWKLHFKMPYMAKNFYDTVPFRPAHLLPRSQSRSAASLSQRAPAAIIPAVPTLDSQTVETQHVAMHLSPVTPEHAVVTFDTGDSTDLVDQSNAMPDPSAAPSTIEIAADLFHSDNTVVTPEHVSKHPVVSGTRTNESQGQNDAMMLAETRELPSNDPIQFLVEFSSSNSPEIYRQAAANRISSQVFSELSEIAGIDPLLSFSDHEDRDESEETVSALVDLYGKDDSVEIQQILFKLDSRPEGTFLQQLTAIVTRHGVPPAVQLTAEELRNSPWAKAYGLASQTVVSDFFSDSETFKRLPDFVSMIIICVKSERVLALAIEQQEASRLGPQYNLDENDEAIKAETIIIKSEPDVEDTPIIQASLTMPEPAQEFDKQVKHEQPEDGQRIVFTIDELLECRKYAYKVQGELIAEEYLKYRGPPLPTSRSTMPAVPPTLPIAATQTASLPVTAPLKWQNFQPQQTDMAAWDALLSRKPTQSSSQATSSKSKPEVTEARATNPSRGKGHVPTNSDCDRLAQKLEGWHLDPGLQGQQLPSEAGSNEILGEARLLSPSMISVEVAPLPRPSSSASKASTSASQSMTEKLTAAFKRPLTASPRIKIPIETVHTRLQAIEGQLNPAGIKNGSASPVIEIVTPLQASVPLEAHTPSRAEELSATHSTVDPMQKDPITGAQQSLLESQSKEVAFQPSPSMSTASSVGSLTVNVNLNVGQVDHFASSGTTTPVSTRLSPRAQLRKGPGLSESRWATGDNNEEATQQSFGHGVARNSQLFGSANAPAFQLSNQSRHIHNIRRQPQSTPHIGFGIASPSPMIPAQPGYVPLEATVITQDPYTGEFRETRGLLKTGSVPVVAHVPISGMSSQKVQENVPLGMQRFVPAAPMNQMPSYPPRSDTHARHVSESSGSDLNFKPGIASNPLSPRGRIDASASGPTSRQALSPVRGGANDLRAELQNRLNYSLAARQNNGSPAHR